MGAAREYDRPIGVNPGGVTSAAMHKRSVVIAGHRTSVSLEAPFWEALKRIAGARGLSLNGLITEIDESREENLSSAIRVYVLAQVSSRRPG